MYLRNKTSEALESCLQFASTVLGFEIIELWLTVGQERQCIYSYSPVSFKDLHPHLVTGYWPVFSDVQNNSMRVRMLLCYATIFSIII